MAKKQTVADKKEFAKILFMNSDTQTTIADKVGSSRVTVGKWVAEGHWQELRAAQSVARPELVNKLLLAIDGVLEKLLRSEEDSSSDIVAASDKISKLAAAIERLDKKANVVDAVEVFMAFGKWLQQRASVDKEITDKFYKEVNRVQNLYLAEQFGTKKD